MIVVFLTDKLIEEEAMNSDTKDRELFSKELFSIKTIML